MGTPHQHVVAASTLDLGPKLDEYFSECLKENKFTLVFCLVTSAIAVVATCLLSFKLRREILAAPISFQRIYYLRITWFPPAFALTSFFSLICPRGFPLLKMVQLQFEGINIMVFGTILFLLLAEESYNKCKSLGLEDNGTGWMIMNRLNAQGPKPHFGVPPFGCCFRCILPKHDLTPRQLILARDFFRQYVYVILITSVLVAWACISLSVERFHMIRKVVGYVQKISGFLAIYGLMILYVATHDLMHDKWRTTAKFVAIKLVVLLCNFQDIFVGMAVEHVESMQLECLGLTAHSEHFWNMYLSSLEAIVVALLTIRAFPGSEVSEGGVHLQVVEMELEALVEGEVECKAVNESDSDSDGAEP